MPALYRKENRRSMIKEMTLRNEEIGCETKKKKQKINYQAEFIELSV